MSKIFRIAITVISFTMFFNFLFTAGFGVYRAVHAVYILVKDGPEGRPGLEIIESLDLFLVSLVFLILSLGFMRLFNPNFNAFRHIELPWLKVEDFFALKHITWNTMLLTMLIFFGTHVLKENGQLDWSILIIPVAVLLFSISAKMLKS